MLTLSGNVILKEQQHELVCGEDSLSRCGRHRRGVYGGVFAQQCRWCLAGTPSPGWYRPHEWPAAHNTAPEEEDNYNNMKISFLVVCAAIWPNFKKKLYNYEIWDYCYRLYSFVIKSIYGIHKHVLYQYASATKIIMYPNSVRSQLTSWTIKWHTAEFYLV